MTSKHHFRTHVLRGLRALVLCIVSAIFMHPLASTLSMSLATSGPTPCTPVNRNTTETFPQSGLIFYHKEAAWETDYVLVDLLSNQKDWNLHIVSVHDDDQTWTMRFNHLNSRSVVTHASAMTSIIVFNTNELPLARLHHLVDRFQPKVLVQLSDETGQYPEYVAELAARVPLLLREYHHAHYPSPANVHYIPLGYIAGMLNRTSSIDRVDIPKVSDRKYLWSFIGNLKQDRQKMIDTFSKDISPHFVSHDSTPQETFEVYKKSIFVPNGRGWVVLDCLRLYEASLAGAIPVIVGTELEIQGAFAFNGDPPPWIYAMDWESAAEQCKLLLHDRQLLQEIQESNLAWWKRQILQTRDKIQQTLLN
jgi:hypothetical protein